MDIVLQSKEDRIGYITLNRPEKRNALNQEMVEALTAAFAAMEADEEVKVIVLQASGTVFSAGADLAYLQSLQQNSYDENLADSMRLRDLLAKIYEMEKVVIARVQGHAIAGGCGLASVCDFVISAQEAKFGYTEVRIGFVPALVMVFLVRKLGDARARELLLGGALITAERAQAIGLVNHVVAADELTSFTRDFAQELCQKNATTSMRLTKQLLARIQGVPLHEALNDAAETNAGARSTPDCQQGIAAFLAGEKISW